MVRSSARLGWLLVAWLALPALAGEPAAASQKSFQWPLPDLLEETTVPGVTWARGVPIAMRMVHLKHTQHELLQLFVNAFDDAGFFIPPDKEQVEGLGVTITALDVRKGISYTAIFQPLPDHTCTVILGEANLKQRRDPDAEPNAIPLFPGSPAPLRMSSEAGSMIGYDAPASATQVLEFYRKSLPPTGYREAKDTPGRFVRGTEELQINIQAKDPRSSRVMATLRPLTEEATHE